MKNQSTRHGRFAGAAAGVLLSVGGASHAAAQSFDCAKATTPVETAICASPDLRAADSELARTYARALNSADADSAARLRLGQRAWFPERTACVAQGRETQPRAVDDCLSRAYRTRTAAVAEIAAASATLPAEPSPAAATLSRGSVPAAGASEAMLTVTSPGRFTLRSSSRTGVSIQIVDMIAGPGEIAGDPGTRDGRLDLLLDTGVYKVKITGATVASGDAALSVTPFAAVAAADGNLLRGGEAAGTLADGQQRSYWVFVGASKHLTADAAGRSLRDLRAWRDGTDLVDLQPFSTNVEPNAGRSLTRMRVDGPVEPGIYLVTAYGGEALPWSGSETAQPFFVRVGPAPFLPGGSADVTIGPSGTVRFALPTTASYVRVDAPDVAPMRLVVRRDGKSLGNAAVERASREPTAAVRFQAGERSVAEITGLQGQRFHLRALAPATSARAEAVGPHVVAVDVAGEGGDEVPATAVLARFDKTASKRPGQVIASGAIRVTSTTTWRRKLNLRGPSTLLVEVASSGLVAVRASGVGAKFVLEPLLGGNAPRADGKRPSQWDVEAGFYTLRIDPVGGAVGVLDLTFGAPDGVAELSPSPASRETIDFGLVTFERTSAYQVLVNSAPRLVLGPRIRALPADLGAGALTVLQAAKPPVTEPVQTPPVTPPTSPAKTQRAERPAGTAAAAKPAAKPLPPKPTPVLPSTSVSADRPLVLPVRTPTGGTIGVSDSSGRAVPFTKGADAIEKGVRMTSITIAPSDAARSLTIAWTPATPFEPLPPLAWEGSVPKLAANTPAFFDLARDERKTLTLDVAEGGLYRIETLGRLQTTATVGTRFLPKLDEADDNGPGHNALLQTWLRGGSYRIRVSAQESAGHLGVVARPARLIEGNLLTAESSSRATLSDGAGVAFPVEIADAGDYRLDLYGLNDGLTARLEDSEGWPLAAPGELSTLRRRFEKGRYRLVVMPPDVEGQVVARLRRTEGAKPVEGHGPHILPFDRTVSAQWREPAAKDAPRVPDRWEFSLPGAARVTLATSEGMSGDLVSADGGKPIARLAKGRDVTTDLAAGRYAVEMRALGRDDRLDYTLDLRSDTLQPNAPRFVELPASIPFAIATDRVVGITTFGQEQMTAVVRNEAGDVVERMTGRTDDWNIAFARRLPAGRYTLDMSSLATPAPISSDEAETPSENADDERPAPAANTGRAEPSGGDDTDDTSVASTDREELDKVEVRLALPDPAPGRDLSLSGTAAAEGPAITRFTLPALDAGTLLVVAADAEAESVLSLERRGASGRTTVAGFSRGRAPVVAIPVGADTRDGWEVAVWPVDGGRTKTSVAARALSVPASSGPSVALAPIGSDGPLARWAIGRLVTPEKLLLSLPTRLDGLTAGSRAGRPLAALELGEIAPQSDSVWFLSPSGTLQSVPVSPVGDRAELALTLDAGDRATLPRASDPDAVRVWRADATDGQPGLSNGAGAGGVASGSALALADGPVQGFNAGGAGPLAVRLKAIDVRQAAPIASDAGRAVSVPPRTAQPVRLPAGPKHLDVQLAGGTGAILSGAEPPHTIWSGDLATGREISGAWTQVLFINTNETPAPVGVSAMPVSAALPLEAGHVAKRFFGASGAVTMRVAAQPGDRLTVGGGQATFVDTGGSVRRGTALTLPGPGSVTIDHAAGLTVAALERGALTPWTVPAPVAAAPPQSLQLSGTAMAFTLRNDRPVLLRARTSAPVILALRQGGKGDPEPMPLGADTRRYLAAGDAELRLFAPQDGPLTGTLDLSAEPVTSVGDGVGEPQVIAAGGSAVFAFDVDQPGTIGMGIRADPDRVSMRLLDENGAVLGEGVAQMKRLDRGRYLLEARAPADGPAITVRPAVVGLKARPGGPPPDVAAKYLELVGMTGKAR